MAPTRSPPQIILIVSTNGNKGTCILHLGKPKNELGKSTYLPTVLFSRPERFFDDDERSPSCRGAEERREHEDLSCHYGDDVGNFLTQPNAEAAVSGKLL